MEIGKIIVYNFILLQELHEFTDYVKFMMTNSPLQVLMRLRMNKGLPSMNNSLERILLYRRLCHLSFNKVILLNSSLELDILEESEFLEVNLSFL